MTAQPRFTVYIASKNYGSFLASAIDSVLRQTVGDWELLIIDDGSTDNTAEVMNLYRGHPQVHLHSTPSVGLPSVCNFALANSSGRYVTRLDGDDIFDENFLLILGNCLDRNPDVALVFPDYYLVDDFGEIFSMEQRARLYQDDHMLELPPNGACTMVRRSVYEEVGPYRIDLGAQDGFDLWTRIRGRYKATNVNLPLFYYRRHGSNLTTNERRILNARRQIKLDTARDRIDALRPIIGVIPCRRNFDFAPDLWRLPLGEAGLLEREITTCAASSYFDHIVIACDNPEAESLVAAIDDPRISFYLRTPESTIRSASIVPTLEAIARRFDPDFLGTTVLSFIQAPFVTTGSIEEALSTLAMVEADSSVGVEEIRSEIYRRTAFGLEPINRRNSILGETEPLYRNAQTCVATRNRNLPRGSLTGATVASFTVSSAETFFIASQRELDLAGKMIADRGTGHR